MRSCRKKSHPLMNKLHLPKNLSVFLKSQ